jgi:hypothetical protein
MKTMAIHGWRITRKLDYFGLLNLFDLRQSAVMALIGLAVYGSGVGVVHFAQKTSGYYGPQPLARSGGGYSYTKVGKSFNHFTLGRTWEWSREQMHEVILASLPVRLRPRLQPHLSHTLELAQRYGVDPFWALAVMWTESHFDAKALSHANAIGLMQIMPDTGSFLFQLKGQRAPEKVLDYMLAHPQSNIELGIYYLSRLRERYNGNYIHATVAYNMGPGWVSKRLRQRLPVGKRNNYLNKVRKYYQRLTRSYVLHLKETQPLYKSSLVYRHAQAGENPLAWYHTMRETDSSILHLPRLASHP